MFLDIYVDKKDGRKFCKFLIPFLSKHILESIDLKRANIWNEFFNKTWQDKQITFNYIIKSAIANFQILEFEQNFRIQINPNIKSKIDGVTIDSLCRMINFGTQEQRPYPIFSDCFKYFELNIQEYFDLYLISVGG